MRRRAYAGDRLAPLSKTLADLLPNSSYQEPGAAAFRGGDLVVLGRITGIAKGPGFEGHRDPSGAPVTVPFGDRRAKWNTLHLRVQVTRQFGHGSDTGGDIGVGLGFFPTEDLDRFQAGLKGLGDVVLFLHKSPVYAYDPALFAIQWSGGMLATVAEDGSLALPFLEPADARAYLEGVGTIDELARLAEGPDRIVALKRDGGVLTRA